MLLQKFKRAFASTMATPALVKQLRMMTGSRLKDCIDALESTNGDMDASKDILRKKGFAEAEKKIDRVAAQGLVAVRRDPDSATVSMIQLACETDFVAKTEQFQLGISSILETIHAQSNLNIVGEKCRDLDFIKSLCQQTKLVNPLDNSVGSQNIEEGLKFTISKTQENCQLVKVLRTTWNPEEGEAL
jgi:elongation factor Ts